MDCRQGYLFNTLGTGHGAACLPGEDALAPLFLALTAAVGAIEAGDARIVAAGRITEGKDAPGLLVRGTISMLPVELLKTI